MADLLRKEPDTQVNVIDGAKGEFTVSVDGREVTRKGSSLPDANEVVRAVHDATHAATP